MVILRHGFNGKPFSTYCLGCVRWHDCKDTGIVTLCTEYCSLNETTTHGPRNKITIRDKHIPDVKTYFRETLEYPYIYSIKESG